MKIFECPNLPNKEEYNNPDNIKLFLAGGITNCWNWQEAVIHELNKHNLNNLLLFNPRREFFDINDKTAAQKQIEWEFQFLNNMDIFSMYFADSEKSVQPICLYELGRHIVRMQYRFPSDWKDRIIIGIEDGYKRTQDVLIQGNLAMGYTPDIIFESINPEKYVDKIVEKYYTLKAKNITGV